MKDLAGLRYYDASVGDSDQDRKIALKHSEGAPDPPLFLVLSPFPPSGSPGLIMFWRRDTFFFEFIKPAAPSRQERRRP